MTIKLTERDVRAFIRVEDEEPVALPDGGGTMSAYHAALRWVDVGDGWKLLLAHVNGHVHRADGTVGVRNARVNYADAWSPTGWVPGTPEWLKLAAQRLHPVTYQSFAEFKPEKED